MNIQERYEDFFNFAIPEEELGELLWNAVDYDFDTDNAFERYFSVELMEKAINKLYAGEISYSYFEFWTSLYAWIFMATTHAEIDDGSRLSKMHDVIAHEVSDIICCLNVKLDDENEEDEDEVTLSKEKKDEYVKNMLAYMAEYVNLLKETKNAEIYLKEDTVIEGTTYENRQFLAINHTSKICYIYIVSPAIDLYEQDEFDVTILTAQEFAQMLEKYKALGYKEIEI